MLRNLVERARARSAPLAKRFKLGHAVLVASPNEGTPLGTPQRWSDTVGWMANLLELFPENPFTTGAAFVANGLVWLARHASGDIPGLHAMDGDGRADCRAAIAAGPAGGRVLRAGRQLQPGRRSAAADARHRGRSVLRIGERSGGAVRGRVAHRSAGCGVHSRRRASAASGRAAICRRFGHARQFLLARRDGGLPRRALCRGAAAAQAARPAEDSARSSAAARTAGGLRGRGGRLPRAETGAAGSPKAARPPAVAPQTAGAAPLRITVVNGDLTFQQAPLLLGHYRATRLTGTERVMNTLIGGAMKQSLDMGLYPLGAGHAPDLREHAVESREPAAHAAPEGGHRRRAGRGGQAERRRPRAHGASSGHRLGAALDRDWRGRRRAVFELGRDADWQRRHRHQRRAGGAADCAGRARGERAA